MKTVLLLLALSLPLPAFDQESYGRALNGWHYDGSARYSLDGAQYRTKKPLVTKNADGERVVKVTVIHVARGWADIPFDLEVVFAPDGSARSARITGSPRGHKVDTGVISRGEASPAPREGQAALSPIQQMKTDLFAAFEAQAGAAASGKELRKRDLISRIAGEVPVDVAVLSAGLRYNLDLILGQPVSAGK
jgi:hypothetical protein